MRELSCNVNSDGFGLITWDMDQHSVNVLDGDSIKAFAAAVEQMLGDDAVKGVIVTSAKTTFLAGADLNWLDGLRDSHATAASKRQWLQDLSELQRLYRRVETGGKPFVAAINGTALGGGFELCLACHRRVVADDPAIQIGLPEAKIGLMPGAGGVQRLVRMLGPLQAAQIASEGRSFTPQQALQSGLIDQIVGRSDLLDAARRWLGGATIDAAVKAWDKADFAMPGPDPRTLQGSIEFAAVNALHRKATYGNYPNRDAILKTIYDGLFVPMDQALKIESQEFAAVLLDPISKAMVRTQFTNMQKANRLASRPVGVERRKISRIGILGAGLMGSGIAHVCARSGINVVLLDASRAAAERGKLRIEDIERKDAMAGRVLQTQSEAALGRIAIATDYSELRGCDLIIEAVFEDRAVKADVTRRAQQVTGPSPLFASNTSTLPITGLAEESKDPTNFIGLHFFSPVQRMLLVEVIRGRHTSDTALAHALDFVRQIAKTPIIVNDSRGFYTSRVFMTYTYEGLHMLANGVAPALIENAGRASGMPVAPLALSDEVGLDLMHSVMVQKKSDLQDKWKENEADHILAQIAEHEGRPGRKGGKGFYDYKPDGDKSLWSGIASLSARSSQDIDIEELKLRFLSIQALEAARCLEENVITKVEDADIGATLGWGFAPWTGGPLSYVDLVGVRAFEAACDRLADRHGERFRPNLLLRKMSEFNRAFYS